MLGPSRLSGPTTCSQEHVPIVKVLNAFSINFPQRTCCNQTSRPSATTGASANPLSRPSAPSIASDVLWGRNTLPSAHDNRKQNAELQLVVHDSTSINNQQCSNADVEECNARVSRGREASTSNSRSRTTQSPTKKKLSPIAQFEEQLRATEDVEQVSAFVNSRAPLKTKEIVLTLDHLSSIDEPSKQTIRMHGKTQATVQNLLEAVDPFLLQLTPQECVMLIAALAKLHYTPSADWLTRFLTVSQQRMGAMGPGFQTVLLRALSKLELMPWEVTGNPGWKLWVTTYMADSRVLLSRYSIDELVRTVEALNTLGYIPNQEWLDMLGKIVQARLNKFDPSSLSRLMLGLTNMKYKPQKPFLLAYMSAVKSKLPLFDDRDLSTTAQALALLKRLSHQDFLQEFLSEVIRKLPEFHPGFLANVLVALVINNNGRPSARWLAAVANTVEKRLWNHSAEAASNVLWGLVMLGHVPSTSFLDAFIAATFSKLHTFRMVDMARAAEGLGASRYVPTKPILLRQWLDEFSNMAQLKRFQPDVATDMLTGLAGLKAALDPTLIDMLLRSTRFYSLKAVSPNRLAKLGWCLKELEVLPSIAFLHNYTQAVRRCWTAFSNQDFAVILEAILKWQADGADLPDPIWLAEFIGIIHCRLDGLDSTSLLRVSKALSKVDGMSHSMIQQLYCRSSVLAPALSTNQIVDITISLSHVTKAIGPEPVSILHASVPTAALIHGNAAASTGTTRSMSGQNLGGSAAAVAAWSSTGAMTTGATDTVVSVVSASGADVAYGGCDSSIVMQDGKAGNGAASVAAATTAVASNGAIPASVNGVRNASTLAAVYSSSDRATVAVTAAARDVDAVYTNGAGATTTAAVAADPMRASSVTFATADSTAVTAVSTAAVITNDLAHTMASSTYANGKGIYGVNNNDLHAVITNGTSYTSTHVSFSGATLKSSLNGDKRASSVVSNGLSSTVHDSHSSESQSLTHFISGNGLSLHSSSISNVSTGSFSAQEPDIDEPDLLSVVVAAPQSSRLSSTRTKGGPTFVVPYVYWAPLVARLNSAMAAMTTEQLASLKHELERLEWVGVPANLVEAIMAANKVVSSTASVKPRETPEEASRRQIMSVAGVYIRGMKKARMLTKIGDKSVRQMQQQAWQKKESYMMNSSEKHHMRRAHAPDTAQNRRFENGAGDNRSGSVGDKKVVAVGHKKRHLEAVGQVQKSGQQGPAMRDEQERVSQSPVQGAMQKSVQRGSLGKEVEKDVQQGSVQAEVLKSVQQGPVQEEEQKCVEQGLVQREKLWDRASGDAGVMAAESTVDAQPIAAVLGSDLNDSESQVATALHLLPLSSDMQKGIGVEGINVDMPIPRQNTSGERIFGRWSPVHESRPPRKVVDRKSIWAAAAPVPV